jgi:hypothetical protein
MRKFIVALALAALAAAATAIPVFADGIPPVYLPT